MLVLSIISLAIMLERAWLYWSLRDDIEALMRDFGRLLRSGDLQGARKRLEASRSAEAAVVVAGLVEADRGVEAAQESMDGASALQRLKLEKRLAFLGTLGNNAPFIGLLGTVIGIVAAFDELSQGEDGDGRDRLQLAPEAVMARISEASVATAVGLLIAIPAVAALQRLPARRARHPRQHGRARPRAARPPEGDLAAQRPVRSPWRTSPDGGGRAAPPPGEIRLPRTRRAD